MQNTCTNRKGKQRKSSSRRGARKENWPKRAKKTAVAGNRTLHHLQIRSIYGGLDCTYGVYTVGQNPYTVIRLRNRWLWAYTVPDIRRTEDTAYIRSYFLGQPYVYLMVSCRNYHIYCSGLYIYIYIYIWFWLTLIICTCYTHHRGQSKAFRVHAQEYVMKAWTSNKR
jgi:hypothetical protein